MRTFSIRLAHRSWRLRIFRQTNKCLGFNNCQKKILLGFWVLPPGNTFLSQEKSFLLSPAKIPVNFLFCPQVIWRKHWRLFQISVGNMFQYARLVCGKMSALPSPKTCQVPFHRRLPIKTTEITLPAKYLLASHHSDWISLDIHPFSSPTSAVMKYHQFCVLPYLFPNVHSHFQLLTVNTLETIQIVLCQSHACWLCSFFSVENLFPSK